MQFSEGYFDTGEILLHYLEGPQSGPPLVLIHGATGNCKSWGAIQSELAKDWHLYMIDQRGHGQSGHARNIDGYNAAYNINDTLAFLRDVVSQPAVVWGHSWGAIVTLLSAGTVKAYLRAAVLEDPPVNIRRDNSPEMNPYMDYFNWALSLKQSTSTLAEITAEIGKANPGLPEPMLSGWAESLYNLDANFLRMVLSGPEIVAGIDFAGAVRAASMPVLLMQADPQMGAALVQEDLEFVLKHNPGFHLVKFPGSGHGIHDDQTDKALEAFRAFVKGL